MEAERYKLVPTKQSLYTLCKRYADIPAEISETKFVKTPTRGIYVLSYCRGVADHFFLLTGNGGQARLEHRVLGEDATGKLVVNSTDDWVPMSELRELDMVEERGIPAMIIPRRRV